MTDATEATGRMTSAFTRLGSRLLTSDDWPALGLDTAPDDQARLCRAWLLRGLTAHPDPRGGRGTGETGRSRDIRRSPTVPGDTPSGILSGNAVSLILLSTPKTGAIHGKSSAHQPPPPAPRPMIWPKPSVPGAGCMDLHAAISAASRAGRRTAVHGQRPDQSAARSLIHLMSRRITARPDAASPNSSASLLV
jgi:hypothetical protein